MNQRATTLLNQTGDATIIWEEQDDEHMLKWIQSKMDQGCVFFIIEPRLGGWLPPKRTKLDQPDQALNKRALSVGDADFAKMFSLTNTASVIKTPAEKVKTVRKAKTAAEVVANETVGVQPKAGG